MVYRVLWVVARMFWGFLGSSKWRVFWDFTYGSRSKPATEKHCKSTPLSVCSTNGERVRT